MDGSSGSGGVEAGIGGSRAGSEGVCPIDAFDTALIGHKNFASIAKASYGKQNRLEQSGLALCYSHIVVVASVGPRPWLSTTAQHSYQQT